MLFFVGQKREIFIKSVFANGHDRMLSIVKKKYQGRGDIFVVFCKKVSCQFSFFDQPLGGGVVIVV